MYVNLQYRKGMHAFHKNVYYMSLRTTLSLHSFFPTEFQTDGYDFLCVYTFTLAFSCFYLPQLFSVWHKRSLNYNVKQPCVQCEMKLQLQK